MRHITLTEELKQKALKEFQEKLFNERFSQNKIDFSFDLKENKTLEDKDKVIINIRTDAWLKMWSLVSSESGEIGWHGTVKRISNKLFEITDILVYPQSVTGVTVQTDDVRYGDWLHKDLTDDQINDLRFHGHSHVNMAVTPSNVDTTWYNQILQSLLKDDFYIFVILNKREDMFIEIYDLATNTIYEKKDIKINVILNDNNYLQNWVTKTKEKAIQQQHSYITNRLDAFTKFEDVVPYDEKTDSLFDDTENLKDLVLGVCKADYADKPLINGIVDELNKLAPTNNYFKIGWLEWYKLNDSKKIEQAQNFWLNIKNTTKNNKPKHRNTYNDFKRNIENWRY